MFIASCYILEVNNYPLEKIPQRFYFVMKITSCRSACTTRDIGVARIFDWGTKSHVMTSSAIFEGGTFCGTKML